MIQNLCIECGDLFALVNDSEFGTCATNANIPSDRREAIQEAYRKMICDEDFHHLLQRMKEGVDVDDLSIHVSLFSSEEDEDVELFLYEDFFDDDEYVGPIYEVEFTDERRGQQPFLSVTGTVFHIWTENGYLFSVVVEPGEYTGQEVWCYDDPCQTI